MDIITKSVAKHLGLKRYFTGRECANGHLSERYVSTGHCIDCVGHLSNDINTIDSEIERISKLIGALPERLVAASNDIQTKANDKIAKIDLKISELQAERAAVLTQFNIDMGALMDHQTVVYERYVQQLEELKDRRVAFEDNATSRRVAIAITAERRAMLPKMVQIRVDVTPHDVEAAQVLIYNYTQQIWPNVTIEDVWPPKLNIKPLFGSVYRVLVPIVWRKDIERQLNEMRSRSKQDVTAKGPAMFATLIPPAEINVVPSIDDTFK